MSGWMDEQIDIFLHNIFVIKSKCYYQKYESKGQNFMTVESSYIYKGNKVIDAGSILDI